MPQPLKQTHEAFPAGENVIGVEMLPYPSMTAEYFWNVNTEIQNQRFQNLYEKVLGTFVLSGFAFTSAGPNIEMTAGEMMVSGYFINEVSVQSFLKTSLANMQIRLRITEKQRTLESDPDLIRFTIGGYPTEHSGPNLRTYDWEYVIVDPGAATPSPTLPSIGDEYNIVDVPLADFDGSGEIQEVFVSPIEGKVSGLLESSAYNLEQRLATAGPGSQVNGASMIGCTNFTGSLYSYSDFSLDSVLGFLNQALEEHTEGTLGNHASGDISHTATSWLVGSNVGTVLNSVPTQLALTTGTSGATRIGFETYATTTGQPSHNNTYSGVVQAVLEEMGEDIAQRLHAGFDGTVTGDRVFNGAVELNHLDIMKLEKVNAVNPTFLKFGEFSFDLEDTVDRFFKNDDSFLIVSNADWSAGLTNWIDDDNALPSMAMEVSPGMVKFYDSTVTQKAATANQWAHSAWGSTCRIERGYFRGKYSQIVDGVPLGTSVLFGLAAPWGGLVAIRATNGTIVQNALFHLDSGSTVSTLIAGESSFSGTYNNPGTINVAYTGSRWALQNNSGSVFVGEITVL